jgi:hypothetical protein
MPVQSIRFTDPDVHARLRTEAARAGTSASALAERLIDEGLRLRRHPMIAFRDGPAGRRAGLINGPEVWEVVTTVVGSDLPPEQRLQRTAELLNLTSGQVHAAMDYYAEFTDEIDAWTAANREEADRSRRLWERHQQLLAR